MIKSQDFLVLIKLLSLQKELSKRIHFPVTHQNINYEYSNVYRDSIDLKFSDKFSVRGLGYSLGISKTEISASLKRSIENNLLLLNSDQDVLNLVELNWKVNRKAIFELIKYAIPYMYPPKQLGLDIGIPTGFTAPILKNAITSAGNSEFIWPSEYGNVYGQSIEPLYKTVAFSAYHDTFVYGCFALIDAYRLGKAREKDIAIRLIEREILGDQ